MQFAVILFGGLALLGIYVTIRYRRDKAFTFNNFVRAMPVSFGISTGVSSVVVPAAKYSFLYLTGNPALVANNRVALSGQDFESLLTSAVIGGLLVIVFAAKGYLDSIRSKD